MVLGELPQEADSLVDGRAVYEIARPARRGGARPGGIREGVNVDEIGAFHNIDCQLEFRIVLSRKADDHVSRERRPIEGGVDALDHLQKFVTPILAIHPA